MNIGFCTKLCFVLDTHREHYPIQLFLYFLFFLILVRWHSYDETSTTDIMCDFTCLCRRSIRNSPLCWLTWHGELKAAAFLINAGWQLHDECWLSLPGKTDDIERFLVTARMICCMPISLRGVCRTTIRNCLRITSDDRDIVPLIMQLPLPLQILRYLTLDSEYDLFY